MKTKLLFYCAILFLILGLKMKNDLLFFFFSVHFSALAIGTFFYNREKNTGKKK